MARLVVLPLLALLLATGANPVRAAGKVRLADLLRQMTDLSVLAEYPDPPYITWQFSSYDRASQTPQDPDVRVLQTIPSPPPPCSPARLLTPPSCQGPASDPYCLREPFAREGSR